MKITKLTAAQRKLLAAEVKSIKQSDGKVTFTALRDRVDAILDSGASPLYIDTLVDEVTAWSDTARDKYSKLISDVQAFERAEATARGTWDIYLVDESVDYEQVLVDGRNEDSADFWPVLLGSTRISIGERAQGLDIDINARLGYAIY